MSNEPIFLTTEQALKAVALDFRGYGAQPMLFCEILRLLFGKKMIFQRQPGKNGLWLGDGGGPMRWLEGGELIEFMCRIVGQAEWPADRLAALCRLVFQSASSPGFHPRTGDSGVRIATEMTAFECRQCGRCCSVLAYQDGFTAEDAALLKAQNRHDVLEWVRITQTAEGRTAYRIWVIPGTNEFAAPCPFLKSGPSGGWLCTIHDVKPQICRSYPVSRKHALMTGCPGFDR